MNPRFTLCLTAFVWRANNDGQSAHIDNGDTGGLTSWGMTYGTYSDYLAQQHAASITPAAFRLLPREVFIPCYKAEFWDKVAGDLLPVGLDLMVFDMAVLASSYHAIEVLQGCVDTPVDGGMGPATKAAIALNGKSASLQHFNILQMAYFRKCRTWPLFHNGWTRRATDALVQAQKDQIAAA